MYLRNDGTHGHDRYGQIKIQVTEDSMGNVLLRPTSEQRQREVASSNWYNGSYTVYLQSQDAINDFMRDYPRATYRDYNGEIRINDGIVILIDSWTYRHWVGGQCGS